MNVAGALAAGLRVFADITFTKSGPGVTVTIGGTEYYKEYSGKQTEFVKFTIEISHPDLHDVCAIEEMMKSRGYTPGKLRFVSKETIEKWTEINER